MKGALPDTLADCRRAPRSGPAKGAEEMVLGAYERWCGVDDAMMTWLMVPEVMEALHIRMDKKATEKNNLNYQVRCLDPSLQTLLCLCGLSVGLRRLASEASRTARALALTLPSLLSSCWTRLF